jgi:uncharacterized protein
MKRYLESHLKNDLPSKIVLLTGPRQCGKTTLAKQLYDSYDYFNYDAAISRLALHEQTWDRQKHLIIFDELHKMKNWKQWLKGIYDTEGIPPEILVTGSARLTTHKKVGDSLAGRYFHFRLHPLDLKEAVLFSNEDTNSLFQQLWNCGGFPEPFLKNNRSYYKRWRKTHADVILREDLINIYTGRDIQAIETLIVLLKERVGSTISYANLARDLERDPNTVKRWLQLLEDLYLIFRVTPYHKNIARSLLKEPKFYFYDHAILEDDGAHLENIVAAALLKELHYLEDTQGVTASLHYLRTKDGKEIDFLVNIDQKPCYLIEVKNTDHHPVAGFKHFDAYFPSTPKVQLVKTLSREKTYPKGLEIRELIPWLAKIPDFMA